MPGPARVLCFGEVLWDFLPAGLFAGGAPFNVCYHLRQLGCEAHPVSAVGDDILGEEVLRRIDAWQIPTESISRDDRHPTGCVRASLGAAGDASYTIAKNVAWDFIQPGPPQVSLANGAQALVFGSLAQRSTGNRRALEKLVEALPKSALRVFDVNLRPPHDDLVLVRSLSRHATLIKLNSEEAARLAGESPDLPGREEQHAREIAAETGCALVCVTAGSRGAGFLRNDTWLWEPGREIDVEDTIGAGDAFLASLVCSLLEGVGADRELLARACRLGEWVASRRGATPPYDSSTPILKNHEPDIR